MKREDFAAVYLVACFCGIPSTIVDEYVEAILAGEDPAAVLIRIRDKIKPPPTWGTKKGSA